MTTCTSCDCHLGLSARAIAYAGEPPHHPHDPSDLKRCVDYCQSHGITTAELRQRMAVRSPQWAALLRHWDELAGMLADEIACRTDKKAPDTYRRMRELLDGAE